MIWWRWIWVRKGTDQVTTLQRSSMRGHEHVYGSVAVAVLCVHVGSCKQHVQHSAGPLLAVHCQQVKRNLYTTWVCRSSLGIVLYLKRVLNVFWNLTVSVRPDVTLYGWQYVKIQLPNLPTPFQSCLLVHFVSTALSLVFRSINSPQTLRFFPVCSSGVISSLLSFRLYLFMEVSLNGNAVNAKWLMRRVRRIWI